MGYLPNSSMQAASTGPTNEGTPCCGSPTARLIGGFARLGGAQKLAQPHERRAHFHGPGEAAEPVGGGDWRSAAVMNID